MSRAFMKELEDAPEPKIISNARPHSVTPAGFRALKERLASASDENVRRAIQDEIDSAVVVEPPQDRDVVAFGASVSVQGAHVGEQTFTIVGETELDVAKGKITEASPLGKALLGARVGDEVLWKRPAGDVQLKVTGIRYESV
jgi:transcription elongation factor GreB